jgi:hypothetical protein
MRDGTLEKLLPFCAVLEVCPDEARQADPLLFVRRHLVGLPLRRSCQAFDRRRVREAVIRAQTTFEGDLAAARRRKQPGSRTRPVRDAVQFPAESRQRSPLLEAPALGPARRGWHARDHARRLPAGCNGVPRRMKGRRQVGGRYIARARGAFAPNARPPVKAIGTSRRAAAAR